MTWIMSPNSRYMWTCAGASVHSTSGTGVPVLVGSRTRSLKALWYMVRERTKTVVVKHSFCLPEQSMASTHITFNTFPIIPSSNPSSTDSAALISGFSFKPLRLSNHPWVRAHLRHTVRDPQKPRLSFLAQHRHMYGPDWFSKPEEAMGVASEEHSPEALLANGTSISIAETDAGSSGISVRLAHASTSGDASSITFPLKPRKSFDIERGARPVAIHRPAMTRSVSAPGRVTWPSPLSNTYVQDPTHPRRSSHKGKRHRAKHIAAPPLGIAAFSSAFAGVLSTSENTFGYARPTNHTPSTRQHSPTVATKQDPVDKIQCNEAGE
jgi:hypothetical protein